MTLDTYINTVHHMDALALMRSLPDASVDMVFIDPPYGNNNGVGDLADARARDKVKGARARGKITPIANDSYEAWVALMPQVLPQINRVLKPTGALCCCCCGGGGPTPVFATLTLWLDQYLQFFQAVIWDKSKRGDGMGWRYRRNYEFVMVAHKRGGKLSWNPKRKARPNVVRSMPTKNELHPTEKPVALVEEFILNHTIENDLVVDCFAGSGTTAIAARNTNRNYIIGDISAEYCGIASARLAQPFTTAMFNGTLAAAE